MTQVESGAILKKVWICDFSPTTCGACAALHGTVIEITEQFNPEHTLSTKKPPNPLQDLHGPPRHPHCHCQTVTYTDAALTPDGLSPDDLTAQAKDWASKTQGMAPLSFDRGHISPVSALTDHLSAQDVRNMSPSKFEMATSFLRACLTAVKTLTGQ